MQAGARGGGGTHNREDAVSVCICRRQKGGHFLGTLLSRGKALEETYCRGEYTEAVSGEIYLGVLPRGATVGAGCLHT